MVLTDEIMADSRHTPSTACNTLRTKSHWNRYIVPHPKNHHLNRGRSYKGIDMAVDLMHFDRHLKRIPKQADAAGGCFCGALGLERNKIRLPVFFNDLPQRNRSARVKRCPIDDAGCSIHLHYYNIPAGDADP